MVNHTLAWAVGGSDPWFSGTCSEVGSSSLALVCVGESREEKGSVPSLRAVTCERKWGQRLVRKAQHYDIIKRYYRTKYAKAEIHGEIH